ncbi:hypothetical protein PAXRUDRAFT_825062 [Paxillus rubicundulus Ve08.2h10]|uniref:Uncharacterized protein n=1 Tax=Paxillus rubicundulus Ve08.2h10 TaxID=930991 RepID=A0A0D0DTL9_9AGAM|nr:hypothetical protein PAXRUDRAFT_825062 [Paxillus rubicundulus Ve08.2h10]
MLSHIVPAVANSLLCFKAINIFVGSVSFTPLFFYSLHLYRLTCREFIPNLPRGLQAFPKILLPTLLAVVVVINEVAAFAGTTIGSSPLNQQPVIYLTHNNESLWLSLNQFLLALYTTLQILFFFFAFYRLAKVSLDRRRIELTHLDEHHVFHGIPWVATGIGLGIIETLAGFASGGFAVALARRIIRLVARTVLMVGLLKGPDVAENFESLNDELHGASRISRRISRMIGATPQPKPFRRTTQPHLYPPWVHEFSLPEDQEGQRGEQRVTIHYEKGRAPFLQIRFSALDVPPEAVLADTVHSGQRSLSRLIPGYASANGRSQQYGGANASAEILTQNTVLEAQMTKPALPAPAGWDGHPRMIHTRQGSGETVSDNMSMVRELELRFPNLPPRVTGKYRGSILGQGYEEDPFPVVGISRESSVRRDERAKNTNEEGATPGGLSSSGSIKRKPAPPLLENLSHISSNNRPTSTWGGLTQTTVKYPADEPVIPTSPWTSTTAYSPQTVSGDESTSSRRTTPRNLFKRASKAMSEASIRSAEWLTSARSLQLAPPPLTLADIERYRSGAMGPSPACRMSDDLVNMSGRNLLEKNRRSLDYPNATHNASARRPRALTLGVGRASTPTHTGYEWRRDRTLPMCGLENKPSDATAPQATTIPRKQDIELAWRPLNDYGFSS